MHLDAALKRAALYCWLTPKRASSTGLPFRTAPRRMASVASQSSASTSAYIDQEICVKGHHEGALAGLTFAVKDMYDVAGQVTGFGNPTWKATHGPASKHAQAVQALLDSGATLRGRTHMDELAYSLNGENKHYGTPRNPACPDRVPGGSSSGSAVACASGDVDFAIGSDTGGGWFARDAELLKAVGGVLLAESSRKRVQLRRLILGKDAFNLAQGATAAKIRETVDAQREGWTSRFGPVEEMDVVGSQQGINTFQKWFQAFRIIQAAEAWQFLGPWITEAKPEFGPGTKERFEAASKTEPALVAEMASRREAITEHMDALLGDDALLLVPAAPGPAPKLNTPPEELDSYRSRLISLTCIAGLARLPQITIPCGVVDGCPVGLGIIGPRGSDEALLEAAVQIHETLSC